MTHPNMYVTYGSSTQDSVVVNESAPEITRDGKGRRYLMRRKFQITGDIFADSEAAFGTAISTLKGAYNSDNVDFSFSWPSGTDTDIDISATGTGILGIYVTEYPHMTKGDGPVYAPGAYWSYSLGLEVVQELISIASTELNMIAFSESYAGIDLVDQPRTIWTESIEGKAQSFQVCKYPVKRILHRVRTEGWFTIPKAPNPLFPANLVSGPKLESLEGPTERFGENARHYIAEYSYEYASADVLDIEQAIAGRAWI